MKISPWLVAGAVSVSSFALAQSNENTGPNDLTTGSRNTHQAGSKKGTASKRTTGDRATPDGKNGNDTTGSGTTGKTGTVTPDNSGRTGKVGLNSTGNYPPGGHEASGTGDVGSDSTAPMNNAHTNADAHGGLRKDAGL